MSYCGLQKSLYETPSSLFRCPLPSSKNRSNRNHLIGTTRPRPCIPVPLRESYIISNMMGLPSFETPAPRRASKPVPAQAQVDYQERRDSFLKRDCLAFRRRRSVQVVEGRADESAENGTEESTEEGSDVPDVSLADFGFIGEFNLVY